ncbi:MAG TPA: hypothetical protein VNC15_01575 [Solirubrobacterales bacterium]|jgi:hypothetical protein|nr:hypothetical protein [Solirubrobacterales bacterium]
MKTMVLHSISLLGTVFLLMTPVAAAEIQRPHEVISVGFPTQGGYFVYATLHPQERVSVFGVQTGVEDLSSGTWSSTTYVKRVPRGSFGNVVHVDFGPLGRIEGRFVGDRSRHLGHRSHFCRGRRPISESGRFSGAVVFRGDGGFLNASTHRAPIAVINRTFKLRCKKGHAADFDSSRPGLFAYVQTPSEFLSDSDGSYLHTILRGKNLVTEFMALEHFYSDTVGFKAVAREWLPDDVATTRSVEVERALEAAFALGEPEQRPETASVHPPLPFNGAAEYTRSLGELDGDLAASFLGKELPLAGPGSEAKICARPNRDKLWNCE